MHPKAGTILRLFRTETGYVSGQHISRELGVSRTAIWKHISALRNDGYFIEAVPSRGYRLVSSPDNIYQGEVTAHLEGARIGSTRQGLGVAGRSQSVLFGCTAPRNNAA